MRWEALFDDLEAQWSAQQAHQLEADVAQAVEWERAQILLVDRLRGSVGTQLQLRLQGGSEHSLLVHSVGADWVSGHAGEIGRASCRARVRMTDGARADERRGHAKC